MVQEPRRAASVAATDAASYAAALCIAAAEPGVGKAERTRLRLLAAVAARLDAGQREAELRVSDIAGNADVAHGTFYRYFPDRPAAIEALVDGFVGFLHAGLSASREGSAASPERIRAATLAYVRIFRANTGLMRLLMALDAEDSSARKRFHALNRDWNRRVAAAMADRRAALSGAPPVPPEAVLPAAYALGGMVDEFLAQLYLRCDPTLASLAQDEDAVADLLTGVWCHGAYGDLPRGR